MSERSSDFWKMAGIAAASLVVGTAIWLNNASGPAASPIVPRVGDRVSFPHSAPNCWSEQAYSVPGSRSHYCTGRVDANSKGTIKKSDGASHYCIAVDGWTEKPTSEETYCLWYDRKDFDVISQEKL